MPDARARPGGTDQLRQPVRAISLHHDIGAMQQLVQRALVIRVAQIELAGAFATAGIDHERRIDGRCAAVTSSTSAPWAASVRPATGPAMMRVKSSTRTPDSGRHRH
jgi:hypothetical protein